ncbi:hypothetical protein F9817_23295 [Vibrio sp. CAIM 722]|uniref:Core-binding (CB) domain-containing protein n=1 Tax=Vibrio eleionomae TaxID=2653505 RepID=A0A7X4RWV1_9VIBR|nr:hypothetical protein [Vibrio eleionomae]
MKSPFLISLKEFMQARHYARKTIKVYLYWTVQFIHYHNNQHPQKLTNTHVEDFLTHLVVNLKCASATQSLALNALVFLYRDFLEQPLDIDLRFRRSTKSRKLPVVLTPPEVVSLFPLFHPTRYCPINLCTALG